MKPLSEKTVMQFSAVEWRYIIRNPMIGLPQTTVFDITLPMRSGEPVRAVATFAEGGKPARNMSDHVKQLVRGLMPFAVLANEATEDTQGGYSIEVYPVGHESE